tara:strand:+ start:375 stop:668 length:294 start_codon:yes stop_codon:yes gene_type:complete
MKTLNQFIEEAASKRCPEGEYYCNTDKKCKKIPKGYKVNGRGWLRPLGGSYYTGARKNGNGNGNGTNGSNGNGHSNGGNGNGNGGNGSGGNGGGNGG